MERFHCGPDFGRLNDGGDCLRQLWELQQQMGSVLRRFLFVVVTLLRPSVAVWVQCRETVWPDEADHLLAGKPRNHPAQELAEAIPTARTRSFPD
jgi:hypothetical protein